MRIRATISIRGELVTQSWDVVAGSPEPALVLSELANGQVIGIPLDPDQIQQVAGEKQYLGNLDLSQAALLPAK